MNNCFPVGRKSTSGKYYVTVPKRLTIRCIRKYPFKTNDLSKQENSVLNEQTIKVYDPDKTRDPDVHYSDCPLAPSGLNSRL